jgi:integrase
VSGSIEKRGRDRWRARYYGPDKKQRSQTFKTESEAQLFLASQTVTKAKGEWVDPSLGKVTVRAWSEKWLATTTTLKPKTRYGYESLLRVHILPYLGNVPLARLEPVLVREWLAGRLATGLSVGRARQAPTTLNLICESALENGRISRSPCRGIRLSRGSTKDLHVLTEEQVALLADACGRYRELIFVLAYGGLRWGEAAGLPKGRVNLLRSRIHVVDTISEVGGRLYEVSTKTDRDRYVKLPRFVSEMLARCARVTPTNSCSPPLKADPSAAPTSTGAPGPRPRGPWKGRSPRGSSPTTCATPAPAS